MRIKIDTWERQKGKFGIYKNCIDSDPLFIPYQEIKLPENRIVKASDSGDFYSYIIDGMFWGIDKAVCREVL